MAARPTWKGYLKISLVNIPIKVFPATDASATLSFNQLHGECQTRIQQKRWCPKCERERKFHKVADRPAWDCDSCGHHLHPLAGTIFHKSSTSLHLWFYAIYLVSSSKCGIAAKQLEREIGVNYKTALRMLHKIREDLMPQDEKPLSGEVEADEAFIGGKLRESEELGWCDLGARRAPVLRHPRT